MRSAMEGWTVRRWTLLWAVLAAAIGVLFALRVPLGLPYDEPSHWQNVLFYADNGRMPELGEPGSTYESQMGPVAYVLGAIVLRAVWFLDTDDQAHVLRVVGAVILMPVLAVLTAGIARQLTDRRSVAIAAPALIATMPLLAAIGGSIQNDYLTVVLIAVALLWGISLLRRPDSDLVEHVVFGVVIGVAVLTKIVALALIPAVLVAYLVRRDGLRRNVIQAAAAIVGAGITSGWWFVRNIVLYGDLTGARGLNRLGISFPPLQLHSVADVAALASSAVSYVYVPVEYYRNLISAPTLLRLVAPVLALVTLIACALLVTPLRPTLTRLGRDPGAVFAVALLAFTVVGWLVYAVTFWYAPFRLVFQAAPVAAVVVAALTRWRWGYAVAGCTLLAFAVADVWMASSATHVTGYPFLFG